MIDDNDQRRNAGLVVLFERLLFQAHAFSRDIAASQLPWTGNNIVKHGLGLVS